MAQNHLKVGEIDHIRVSCAEGLWLVTVPVHDCIPDIVLVRVIITRLTRGSDRLKVRGSVKERRILWSSNSD